MADSVFQRRLTEERKKKKISQKQAAKDLGISQALLSHYENGVRECGLSFVVKAANYYGVSCDYLLGNSRSTIKIDSTRKIDDIPEDETMSSQTIVRAALSIAGKIIKDKELVEFMKYIYGLATYFMLYASVKKGVLPISWLGGDGLNRNRITYMSSTLLSEMEKLESGSGKPIKDQDHVPAGISTIVSWANDYLNISIANLI